MKGRWSYWHPTSHYPHITLSPHHTIPTSHYPHIPLSPHHTIPSPHPTIPTSHYPHIPLSPHPTIPTSHYPHIPLSPHPTIPTSHYPHISKPFPIRQMIYGTVSAKIAPRLKGYKNASRLNRYNFPTDNAIDFLFSTLHTTPFHYEVLKKGSR